jgi:hypothetical protein
MESSVAAARSGKGKCKLGIFANAPDKGDPRGHVAQRISA